MNKKLLVISILAVLMLVAISFASAVSSNTTTDEQRESPLFRIRTRKAIGERLDELKDVIKTKFIGERVFFLPFQLIRNIIGSRSRLDTCTFCGFETCEWTDCSDCTWEHERCTNYMKTCENVDPPTLNCHE